MSQSVPLTVLTQELQRFSERQNRSLLCPFEDSFRCVRTLSNNYLEGLYTFHMCKHKLVLSYRGGVCVCVGLGSILYLFHFLHQ